MGRAAPQITGERDLFPRSTSRVALLTFDITSVQITALCDFRVVSEVVCDFVTKGYEVVVVGVVTLAVLTSPPSLWNPDESDFRPASAGDCGTCGGSCRTSTIPSV